MVFIKYVGKNYKTKRGADLPEFEYFDEVPEIALPKITKRKAFDLVPMTEEEALIQMDNVGNDFFVFMNSAVNRVCLLYIASVQALCFFRHAHAGFRRNRW